MYRLEKMIKANLDYNFENTSFFIKKRKMEIPRGTS